MAKIKPWVLLTLLALARCAASDAASDLQATKCSADAACIAPGSSVIELKHREKQGEPSDRTVHMHVPHGPGPFPVLIMLHGFGDDGRIVMKMATGSWLPEGPASLLYTKSELERVLKQTDAGRDWSRPLGKSHILVAPDGPEFLGLKSWNMDGDGREGVSQLDDAGFVGKTLIDHLATLTLEGGGPAVNATNIKLFGYSMGAMLVNRILIENNDTRITRAVTTVGQLTTNQKSQLGQSTNLTKRPLLQITGVKDIVIPAKGGKIVPFQPLEAVEEYVVIFNSLGEGDGGLSFLSWNESAQAHAKGRGMGLAEGDFCETADLESAKFYHSGADVTALNYKNKDHFMGMTTEAESFLCAEDSCKVSIVPGTSVIDLWHPEKQGEQSNRTVHMHVPHGPGPFPALIMLHGWGGNGKDFMKMATGSWLPPNWRVSKPLGKSHILVAPDGLIVDNKRSWNTENDREGASQLDDAGFVGRTLIDHLATLELEGGGPAVNATNIKLFGYSMGAMLVNRILIENNDTRITRAVTTVGQLHENQYCDGEFYDPSNITFNQTLCDAPPRKQPLTKRPLLQITAADDKIIPAEGGTFKNETGMLSFLSWKESARAHVIGRDPELASADPTRLQKEAQALEEYFVQTDEATKFYHSGADVTALNYKNKGHDIGMTVEAESFLCAEDSCKVSPWYFLQENWFKLLLGIVDTVLVTLTVHLVFFADGAPLEQVGDAVEDAIASLVGKISCGACKGLATALLKVSPPFHGPVCDSQCGGWWSPLRGLCSGTCNTIAGCVAENPTTPASMVCKIKDYCPWLGDPGHVHPRRRRARRQGDASDQVTIQLTAASSAEAYGMLSVLSTTSAGVLTSMVVQQLQASDYTGPMPSSVTAIVQDISDGGSSSGGGGGSDSSENLMLLTAIIVAGALLLVAALVVGALVYLWRTNKKTAGTASQVAPAVVSIGTLGVQINPMRTPNNN